MPRLLRYHVTYCALIVASIALGVGSNVAVFAIVNALWLQPLPVANVDRIMVLMGDTSSLGQQESLIVAGIESQTRWSAFASVAGQVSTSGDFASLAPRLRLNDVGAPLETAGVTSAYFHLLGLSIRGRDFSREDNWTSSEPVAIISDRLWNRAFERSAHIVGAVVGADPLSVRIIGVAPPGFHGARRGEQVDVWVPANLVPRLVPGGIEAHGQDSLPNIVFVRLHQSQTKSDVLSELLANTSDEGERRLLEGADLVPLEDVFGTPSAGTIVIRETNRLRALAGLAGLVILASCVTLSALVLMHYERRRGEMAVRAALGASRSALARLFAVELSSLVLIGAGAAMLLATWALSAMPSLPLPGGLDISRLDLRIDWRVVMVALLAAGLSVSLAAAPAFFRVAGASSGGLLLCTSILQPSSRRLRQALLAAHVAATVVVLVSAGLFLRSVTVGARNTAGFDRSCACSGAAGCPAKNDPWDVP